jgi:hypothetical protein
METIVLKTWDLKKIGISPLTPKGGILGEIKYNVSNSSLLGRLGGAKLKLKNDKLI